MNREALNAGLRAYYESKHFDEEMMIRFVYRAIRNVEEKTGKLKFDEDYRKERVDKQQRMIRM